jgi:tryptophan synthase alpha chain
MQKRCKDEIVNRIDAQFDELSRQEKSAFIPFLTAGDPDLETTRRIILAAEDVGADLIELGFPFSDPLADGPTIQASYSRVLERGQKSEEVFGLVESVRDESEIPIVAMISYSLVYRMGFERFLERACEAGLDGATIPDLPVEEMEPMHRKVRERDFHLVCFVTPATEPARRSKVVSLAGGFIYYIAVRGITGERKTLPEDLAANLRELKSLTEVPVAVGFGISQPEQARVVAGEADGVIVGSAIVRRIRSAQRQGTDPVVAAADFIEQMVRATKGLETSE